MKSGANRVVVPPGYEYVERFLAEFLRHFPHVERNVFVMMPFTSERTQQIYDAICAEVKEHGLVPLRADQRSFAQGQLVWWNIVTYMLGSSYGIVIYEPTTGVTFNPNVSIEAGFMLALDREVLLLANGKIGNLPVDLSGRNYKMFDPDNVEQTVRDAVKDWIEHDLSYYEYGERKLVVLVSLGGTCRCVMGKAIMSQRLHERKLKSSVEVEAAAAGDPYGWTLSPSALTVLQEIGCDHWVLGHRPRKLNRYLRDRADLIVTLVGDHDHPKTPDRANKVITDEELFGQGIADPWPDNEDEATLERYRSARDLLISGIDESLDDILRRIGGIPAI